MVLINLIGYIKTFNMRKNYKNFFLIFILFLARTNCQAQYFDSSVLINAALGLYYELPSLTHFSKKQDSLNRKLRLKRVRQKCFKYDSLLLSKTINYNEDGTISSMVTKYNEGNDSIELYMHKKNEKEFLYSFSFPFEAIKDTMDFGFSNVIDSLGLNEARYNIEFSLQLVDSLNAENFKVSVNNKFIEKRSSINLYPFFELSNEGFRSKASTTQRWDTTFENGYLVKFNLDSANFRKYMLNRNFYQPNSSKVHKHEYYTKSHNQDWILRTSTDFFYDDSGRIIKKVENKISKSITVDTLIYYPNGILRAIKEFSTIGTEILKESLFSIEGRLISEHFYGRDYSQNTHKIDNAYNDNFFTYNHLGLVKNYHRYYNNKLIYFEEYDYEYWNH